VDASKAPTVQIELKITKESSSFEILAKFKKFQLKKDVFDFTDYNLNFDRKKELNFRLLLRIRTRLVDA